MKGAIIVACLMALTLASPSLQTQAGKLCTGGTGAFTVTSMDVNPWPLTKNVGVVANMTGTFSSAQTITGLYLHAVVNGILPFNDVVAASGTFTPGQTGSFIQKAHVPSIAPSGSYVVKIGLVNSNNEHLNCWEIDFKL
jgi:hypothetical protein